MSPQRRPMTAALQTAELNDNEIAFIRGENVKNAVTTTASPNRQESAQPSVSDIGPTMTAKPVGKATLRVVPSVVSLSSRIPGELHERLMRAAFERKLAQQEPFTHQDIITEALSAWLKKAGFP